MHDMKSIETLSRVDVLCVDKTGTITEPGMQVSHILWRRQIMEESGAEVAKGLWDRATLQGLLADYVYASTDNNATMDALRAAMDKMTGVGAGRRKPSHIEAFSSANKYGSMTFPDGRYFLGAPEFIMKDSYDTIAEEITPYVQKGYRVLLFARQEADGILPLGYVTLSNPIRANAKETFSYFKEQDVAIRVISGDNPQTVSEVARRAGIEGAENYVDATTLDSKAKIRDAVERYTVFGRVTPKQKQLIVKALQEAGHTVAMTGDGVNDILAMKDADCSVAMASGSEACAQAAQVVLLDSDFAKMPEVVYEGRQVVNNVGRSASLFLVKNIFSLLMSVFSALFMITYPLEPSQISLISMFTIGIPGFFAGIGAKPRADQGTFYARGPSAGTSGRADGCSGSRCAGDLRAGLFPSVGRCCDSGDPAFVCGRLYDPDQDIQTDEWHQICHCDRQYRRTDLCRDLLPSVVCLKRYVKSLRPSDGRLCFCGRVPFALSVTLG